VSFDSRQTNQFAPPPFNNFTTDDSQTNLAMKLGGGLDVRLGRWIDLRLVEINYNPVFGGERKLVGGPLAVVKYRFVWLRINTSRHHLSPILLTKVHYGSQSLLVWAEPFDR
jgi:hypothetical protein